MPEARAFKVSDNFYGGVMNDDELREFLTGPNARWLIKIATIREDGWPSVVPVWYQWTGGAFYVIGRKRSAWVQDLIREPRCAICVEELEPVPPAGANRKVLAVCVAEIVEGPVVAGGSLWAPIAAEMAARYMGDVGVRRIQGSETWERYLVKLVPRDGKITSWQGIDWHPRYFDPGQRPDLAPSSSRSHS
jgi:Pyridoxamine 5'-phosphate oxidase